MAEKNKVDLIAPTDPKSPAGQTLIALVSAAEEALASADAAELFRLFELAVKERGEALHTVGIIAAHYVGDKNAPRYAPSENAIQSMERIALAAIDLAKATVAEKKT